MGKKARQRRVANPPPSSESAGPDHAVTTGTIATIHSLKSAGGKQLNRKRCILLNPFVDENDAKRFHVMVEHYDGTYEKKGIRPENLRRSKSLPLPTGSRRGTITPTDNIKDPRKKARILAENLVWKTNDYSPYEIVFVGEAANHFMNLPGYPDSFRSLHCQQMEQIGGILALSHLGKEKLNELAFALLEADPMIIDVMISTFTGTPHMGVDTPSVNLLHLLVKDRLNKELTGDQESDAYIAFISRGPITLLQTLLYGEFYPAFQVALQKSSLFPLLVRRLLRIITREVEGTKDAMTVSFHCKGVLDISTSSSVLQKILSQGILDSFLPQYQR